MLLIRLLDLRNGVLAYGLPVRKHDVREKFLFKLRDTGFDGFKFRLDAQEQRAELLTAGLVKLPLRFRNRKRAIATALCEFVALRVRHRNYEADAATIH